MMETVNNSDSLRVLLKLTKSLAVEYYRVTGKPLGVTGEVAELEAAEKLGLRLSQARTAYYDAEGQVGDNVARYQIKGRAVAKDDRYRGRMPSVKCDGEFEYVLLVLLDKSNYDAIEILQADRRMVAARLEAPGSKSRNERNSLGISQFKSIARRVWPSEPMEQPAVPQIVRQPHIYRPAAQPGTAGGTIGKMIHQLLLDHTLDYAQIVHRVKLAHPSANTSTKSVASTARDLRRRGVNIPPRVGS